MKKMSVFTAVAVLVLGMFVTSCSDYKSSSLKTAVDSASYAIGVSIGTSYGENLKTLPGEEANLKVLIAGFIQALEGETTKMTMEEAQTFLQTYFTEVQAKESAKAKEEGNAFLAENKTKSGVITTESGLQYKVDVEGTGPKPTAADMVKVHYTGKLLDETIFESSVGNEPVTFGVGQVILGWQEGLQIMPVGSKYTFWIPSDLAYGEQGGGQIMPNSTLIFEVELLEIVAQ